MGYKLAFKDRYYSLAEEMPDSTPTVPHLGDFSFRQLSLGVNELILKVTSEEMKWIFDSATQGAMMLYPEQAQTVLEILLRTIDYPPEFPSEGQECPNYLPSMPFVAYTPQNPYNQPDYIPPDYLVPPFFVNSANEYPDTFGYLLTDVFVNPAALTIDPIVIANAAFPTIIISVIGSGQIELDLLAVQAGSFAVIKVGSPPNILEILGDGIIEAGVEVVDLNNDGVGVPPESDILSAQEIEITAASGVRTDVYVVFVPTLDDSLIPLRFGGGIRQIGLCGFEEMGGAALEDVRFDIETCTFEKRILGVWTAIENGDDWLLCVEALLATQAEIKQAIIDAAEQLAAQMISGVTDNLKGSIEIDNELNTTIKIPGMQPDDPLSTADEEARSGGASAIRLGINTIWSYIKAWYEGGVVAATSKTRLKSMYILDGAATDTFVDFYYAERGALNPYISSFASTLDGYLFCKGQDVQAMARWTVDTLALSLQDQAFKLFDALTQEQIDTWYNSGSLTPSTDYVDYPCTKTPPETILVNLDTNVYYQGVQTWKANHRLRITVLDFFTDPQGDIVDFWWNKPLAGAQTFKNNDTRIDVNAVEQEDATTNEVPYTGSHSYSWTMVCLNTGIMRIRVNRGTGIDPATTGTFSVLIEDLGEIIQ